MNRELSRYVNFLFENNPSPFCDYIINKELLRLDAETVRGAYEWAKQFKLYKEIEREQLPDGSWGGFDTAHTELVKAGKRKYKATARAIIRLLDLSLDGIDDPMVNKVIGVMKKYLTGELPDPEFYGKNNIYKPISIRQQMIRHLGYFEPENAYVAELRNLTAEYYIKSCESGSFNKDIWNNLKYDFNGLMAGLEYSNIEMLSHKNIISDDIQRILLADEWKGGELVWGMPVEIKPAEESGFHFLMFKLQKLQNFSLFGEFMAEKMSPYLYSVCDKIVNDTGNQMDIKITNYIYHQGQYSESRNTAQKKKNDLLLQIIRILDKCK